MKNATFALLLVFISCNAHAASRNCTAQEKSDANAQLSAIEADSGWRSSILSTHLPFGIHQSSSDGNEQLMYQGGYVFAHDSDLLTSIWTSYRLDGDDIEGAAGQDRVNCFRRDPRLSHSEGATPADYDEPTFDQGHMTNDADLKDDVIEQVNTYVMSNMSPQHCKFNRGIWLSLEHLTRIWANNNKYGSIHVTSGAVFNRDESSGRDADDDATRMESRNGNERVAVPSHYYKVILRQDESGWKSVAFLLDHTNDDHGSKWNDVKPDVLAAIVPISEIEELASITLHPALNRGVLVEADSEGDWDFTKGKGNLSAGIKDNNNCVISAQ